MSIQCTYYQEGNIIDYTNTGSSALSAGDPVPMTDAFGVAVYGIDAGDTGPVVVSGVFIVTVDSTVSYAAGDKLYWDATNKLFTTSTTSTTYAGYAAKEKAVGTSVGYLKLNY
ncbi:MAG: hypothetical protein H6Q73_1813 [Firmicutes bacterium]|nr:hypothetical protein [Bacillota bacterium]